MNIYGDNGNVLTLQRRIEQHGYEAKLVKVDIGQKLPQDADIILAGGGQDSGQLKVKLPDWTDLRLSSIFNF